MTRSPHTKSVGRFSADFTNVAFSFAQLKKGKIDCLIWTFNLLGSKGKHLSEYLGTKEKGEQLLKYMPF